MVGVQEVGDKVEVRTINQLESKGVYTGNMRAGLQSNIIAGQHEGDGSIWIHESMNPRIHGEVTLTVALQSA